MNPSDHFVCVQSIVCDGGGSLWLLDPAAPGLDKVIARGPKLVRIDLASNKIIQIIKFGEDVALLGSYLNDVRFHPDGRTAFITDSGAQLILAADCRPHALPHRHGPADVGRRRGSRTRRSRRPAPPASPTAC